jgi:hypothetical protein
MKKRGLISIGLLLMLLVPALLWLVDVAPAVASAWCSSTTTLSGSVTHTASSARCYRFSVPSDSNFVRIKLEPISGTFDLYYSASQVTFLSNWDKVDEAIDDDVAYAFLEPQPGTHTITVVPSGSSGRFRLTATTVGAASSASNQPSHSCSGKVCSHAIPLTASGEGGAVELGPDFGDRVIFPIEIGGPGRVEVRATWRGTARTLALILNGPDRPELTNPVAYYAREDGDNPLSLTYTITADDFRRGRKWRVSLINFSGGQATGNLDISYPATSTQDNINTQARLNDFVGHWENVDANTGGITKINIDRVGNSLRVHTWGACVPSDCDHGTVTAAFQRNPVEVSRRFSFKQEILTLWLLRNGELRVLSDNVFTDGTRRDYASEFRFRRASGSVQRTDSMQNFRVSSVSEKEIQFTVDYGYNTNHGSNVWVGAYVLRNGQQLRWFGYRPVRINQGNGRATIRLTYGYNSPPTSVTSDQVRVFMYVGGQSSFYSKTFDYRKVWSLAPEGLSAPKQLSPADGAVFSHYPRTTTLRWSAVPGAVKYTVQIDCYGCCEANKWCTNVGRNHKLVPNVEATSYTFDFVGAQPGAWRVWAVDATGREGPKSDWRTFKYTR